MPRIKYRTCTLTDFPISIRLTSLALWQSNDCPSASKATLMNMDKYFMWIHYERLHNHNKAKHNKTVCIFLGIYCSCVSALGSQFQFFNLAGLDISQYYETKTCRLLLKICGLSTPFALPLLINYPPLLFLWMDGLENMLPFPWVFQT